MGKIIIKDGVRYTEQHAKRLGIKADETRETEPAHTEGEVRVDGAPAGVVLRGDVRTSDNTLITTDTASLAGTREEGTLPGSLGTVGAPAAVQEGTPNDGSTSGDTGDGDAAGESRGSGDSSEKAGKRPARGARSS